MLAKLLCTKSSKLLIMCGIVAFSIHPDDIFRLFGYILLKIERYNTFFY